MSNDSIKIRAKGTVIKYPMDKPIEIATNEIVIRFEKIENDHAFIAIDNGVTEKHMVLQEGQSLKLFWDLEKLIGKI